MNFDDLLRKVVGNDPKPARLISLLERGGFLVSDSTGYYDYEIRVEVINKLSKIGGNEALDILRTHKRMYDSSNYNDQQVYHAAKRAIQRIEQRNIPIEEGEHKSYLALTQLGSAVRVVPLALEDTYSFQDSLNWQQYIGFPYQYKHVTLKKAADEFEKMINDRSLKEKDYQEFFKEHKDFILMDEHVDAHPHLVLERETIGSLIPDFILEPFTGKDLCDILEIKTPYMSPYVCRPNRERFSAVVLDAIEQLRTYSEFFDDPEHRAEIEGRYGLSSYKPKMYLIVGRRGGVQPLMAKKIHSRAPDVELKTYDDVLALVKHKIKKLSGR